MMATDILDLRTKAQIEAWDELELAEEGEEVPPDPGWSIRHAATARAEKPDDVPGIAAEIADRQVQRIARLRRQRRADEYVAEQKIQSIEGWLEERRARAEKEAARLEVVLYAYSLDFPPPKGKSISLPSGKLRRRANRPHTEKSEEAARAFIRAQGLEAMETYFRAAEPPIDWERFSKDIEFDTDGQAIFAPTGEIMEVQIEYEDGHTETMLVKRRVPPAQPEIFEVEIFDQIMLGGE